MLIQEEMLKEIIKEIDDTINLGNEKVLVNNDKAKQVAEMLTSLSTNSTRDADELTAQYIARIKTICNSQDYAD